MTPIGHRVLCPQLFFLLLSLSFWSSTNIYIKTEIGFFALHVSSPEEEEAEEEEEKEEEEEERDKRMKGSGRYYIFGRVYPNPKTIPEYQGGVRTYDRYSPEQLQALQLHGLPIKYDHATSHTGKLMKNSVIGHILYNEVSDEDGSMYIVGYLDTKSGSSNQRALAAFTRTEMQRGRLQGLSIAHTITQQHNRHTGEFRSHLEPLEISVVDTPDYAECQIVCHGAPEDLGEAFVKKLDPDYYHSTLAAAQPSSVESVRDSFTTQHDVVLLLAEVQDKIKILARKNVQEQQILNQNKQFDSSAAPVTGPSATSSKTVQNTLSAIETSKRSAMNTEETTQVTPPDTKAAPEAPAEVPAHPAAEPTADEPPAKRQAMELPTSLTAKEVLDEIQGLTPERLDTMSKSDLVRSFLKAGKVVARAQPIMVGEEERQTQALQTAIARVNTLKDEIVNAVASDSSQEQADVLRKYFEQQIQANQHDANRLDEFVNVQQAIAAHAGSTVWRQKAEEAQRRLAETERETTRLRELGLYKSELNNMHNEIGYMNMPYSNQRPAVPSGSTSSVAATPAATNAVLEQKTTTTFRTMWDEPETKNMFDRLSSFDPTGYMNGNRT